MKVLKFGGTSVGSAEMLNNAIDVIQKEAAENPLFVIVSAFSGVTNLLDSISQVALSGEGEELIEQFSARHMIMAEQVIDDLGMRKETYHKIASITQHLRELCKGIHLLEELTDRTRARILSAGELLSSAIITEALKERGLDAVRADSRDLIRTEGPILAGHVVKEVSYNAIADYNAKSRIVVMPGFIARNGDGATSTLGRGGSDLTASIVAAARQATELQIWTDVDGVMTADPRFVNGAHVIHELTYEEAMELSHFGAKVIYPPTMRPLIESGIPLAIRNTTDPDAPGTVISGTASEGREIVKGISRIPDIALVTISGPGMIGMPGIAMRVFRALAESRLNVLFITQSSSEHTITVGLEQEKAEYACHALEREFEVEMHRGRVDTIHAESEMSLLAAVGEGMKRRPGVAAKLFGLLGENGINIRAIAQGSTERNVTMVIRNQDASKALNVLHEGFFLSPVKVAHLFLVGVGNVGSKLIAQLQQQHDELLAAHNIDLRVTALANSRKFAFEPEGLDLSDWRSLLDAGVDFTPETFSELVIDANLRNAIFVDNTGSQVVAGLYNHLISNNIHVVTSNKIAASGESENYHWLRGQGNVGRGRFLFETNVAAGLPVIGAIRDLIMTGDRIHRIEAILSGSLNYIFNTLSHDVPFSEAVTQARDLGLTEPDPAIDLTGLDVKRKILILAREAGRDMELEDIGEGKLLPEGVETGLGWDELLEMLQDADEEIEQQRQAIDESGKQWRFIAVLDGDEARVGLSEIDETHPAWILEGKDNIVLVYSDRYKEQPLVVKGAGAGPDVTAGGVLADILRIVNA